MAKIFNAGDTVKSHLNNQEYCIIEVWGEILRCEGPNGIAKLRDFEVDLIKKKTLPGGACLQYPINKKFRIQKKVEDKEFFSDLSIGHTFLFGEVRYIKITQTEGSSQYGQRKFNPMDIIIKTRGGLI